MMKLILLSLLLIVLCAYCPHIITAGLALVSCAVTLVVMVGSTLCSLVSAPVLGLCAIALLWFTLR